MRPMLDPALAALFRALKAEAGGPLLLVEGETRPWATATFEGGQHRLTLRIAGEDGVARAARLAAALPELEFRLPGHLVADVAEIVVLGDELRCSVLTVVDA